MSLAKRILEETNEEFRYTELYNTFMNNIDNIISGLDMLSKDLSQVNNSVFGEMYKSLELLCQILDKSGFTYFPQPFEYRKNILGKILRSFSEYYQEVKNDFTEDMIETLNTNSKDLLNILEKLK